MAMEVVEDPAILKAAVYNNRAVLIAVVDVETEIGRYVVSLLRTLEELTGRRLAVKVLKVRGASPLISFFLNGREVFRQDEVFGELDKDVTALRMSIRSSMEGWA